MKFVDWKMKKKFKYLMNLLREREREGDER